MLPLRYLMQFVSLSHDKRRLHKMLRKIGNRVVEIAFLRTYVFRLQYYRKSLFLKLVET